MNTQAINNQAYIELAIKNPIGLSIPVTPSLDQKLKNSSKQTAKKKLPFFTNFLLGGISASIAKTCTGPIERVKLILQNQMSHPKLKRNPELQYKGITDCLTRVVKEEGFWALWRGNTVNILRYFPQQALNFAFKEKYQYIFCTTDPNASFFKKFGGNVASGGAAGATSLCFVYPQDFIRTRLGVDLGKSYGTNGSRQFGGMFDCARKIVKSDGVFGLYRGFGISITTCVILRGIQFGIYDTSKLFIGDDASLLTKFCFAQFSSVSGGMVCYPMDTIRRRMMMQSGKTKADLQYRSSYDTFKKILGKEGYRGFYKGGLSNVFKSVGVSIVLCMYDDLQKCFAQYY